LAAKELKIVIDVDAKTGDINILDKEFRKIDESSKKADKGLRSFRDSLTSISTAIASVYGLSEAFSFLKSSISIAGEFERFGSILETIEGSAEKARKSLDWVKEFAQTTPYELAEVTDAFVKMKSYGLNPLGDGLRTLGDTAAAMGKPLIQAVEAMADAVTGENERLKEFGIKASKIGDRIKYTWTDASGKAKKIIIKNNKEIIESTLKAIFNSKYAGAMDRMSRTWQGLTSNLSDAWTNFKQSLIIKSGIFDSAKKAVSSLNSYFSKLLKNKNVMKSLADAVSSFGKVTIDVFKAVAKGATYLSEGFLVIKYGWDKVANELSLAWVWLKKKFYELIDTLTSWLPSQPSWAIEIKKSLSELNVEYDATKLKSAELDENLIKNIESFDSLRGFIDKTTNIMKEGVQTSDKAVVSADSLSRKTKETAKAFLEANGAIDETAKTLDEQKKAVESSTKAWQKHLEEVYRAQDVNLDKYLSFLEDMGRKEEAWQIKRKKLIEEYSDTLTKEELDRFIELKKKEYLEEKKNLDRISELWKESYKEIKDSIEDTFSNFLLDGESFKSAFRRLLDDIKKSLLSPFVKTISESFSGALLKAIGLTKDGLSNSGLLSSLGKLLTGDFKGFGGDVKNYTSSLWSDLKNAGSGLLSGASSLFSGSSSLTSSLGSIGKALGEITSLIAPIGGLVSGVSAIIKGLKGEKRLDQVGIEVRDGLINISKGVDALANTLAKYEIYKTSSWLGTKTNIRDYMIPKEWENAINNLLKAYDSAAKALGYVNDIVLDIKNRNYQFDEFVDEIGLAFIRAISKKPDTKEIEEAWKNYAKSINKSINEAILSELGRLGDLSNKIKNTFNELSTLSIDSAFDKLRISARSARESFWELAQSIDGGTGVNLKNFSYRLKQALSESLTPETIKNWERLGDALLDATNKSKSFVDGLKGLISAYQDEIRSIDESINRIKGVESVKVTTEAIEEMFEKFRKASADTKLEVARNIEEMVNAWRDERINYIKSLGLDEATTKQYLDEIDKKAIAWLEGAKSGLETETKSLSQLLAEETKKLSQMTGALTALTALEQIKNDISTQTLEQAIKELQKTMNIATIEEKKQTEAVKANESATKSVADKTDRNTKILSDINSQNITTNSNIKTQTSFLRLIDNNTANTKSTLFSLKASTDQITITIREQIGWSTGVLGAKLDQIRNNIIAQNNSDVVNAISSWANAIATTIREQTNYETGTLGAKLDNIASKIGISDATTSAVYTVNSTLQAQGGYIANTINGAKSAITSRLSNVNYTGYLTDISTKISSWGNAIATTVREQANYIVSSLSNATYSVRNAINAKSIGGATVDPRPNIDSAKSVLYGIMYSVYSMTAGIKSDLGYTNRLLQQIAANTA